jgi:uncharacterized protein
MRRFAGRQTTRGRLNSECASLDKPAYTLSGFCVGALAGMTGVGGGSLMTPLLILLFGIHPATAVGTDLLYAAATKTGGTLVHAFYRTIDWPVVGRLAAGSILATCVTILFLSLADVSGETSPGLINTVLSAALMLTACVLTFRRTILNFYAARVGTLSSRRTALFTVAFGAILGGSYQFRRSAQVPSVSPPSSYCTRICPCGESWAPISLMLCH